MDAAFCAKTLGELKDAMAEVKDNECQKLKATGLASDAAFRWLEQALGLTRVHMEQLCVELRESVAVAAKRAAALALKAPSFLEEANFRAVLAKLSTRMAEEGKGLKKLSADLCATASQLPESLSQRATFLQEGKASENLANLLATQVTLYACVTMLRASAIGAKGEPGKKAAASLQSLMYTLLTQDLRITPCSNLLPDEGFEALWEEAVAAAALMIEAIKYVQYGLIQYKKGGKQIIDIVSYYYSF